MLSRGDVLGAERKFVEIADTVRQDTRAGRCGGSASNLPGGTVGRATDRLAHGLCPLCACRKAFSQATGGTPTAPEIGATRRAIMPRRSHSGSDIEHLATSELVRTCPEIADGFEQPRAHLLKHLRATLRPSRSGYRRAIEISVKSARQGIIPTLRRFQQSRCFA